MSPQVVSDQAKPDEADYSFIAIPQEVKNAWINLHATEVTLRRLQNYAHMNAAMVRDAQQARDQQAQSRTILNRFFITTKIDSRSGIKKGSKS